MTYEIRSPRAVVYVTADGTPDAHVAEGKEIEVCVTQPDTPVQVVIVIPIEQARSWAADLNAEVVNAYHYHHASAPTPAGHEPMPCPPGVLRSEQSADWWPSAG